MDDSLRHTPLYATHVDLGARCVPFAGYAMPVQYSSIREEHEAVRTAAGLFDVSHMGQLFLSGKGAIQLLDYLATGDIAGLAVGHARYTVFCNVAGMILDDLIVYRLDNVRCLVICNASNRAKIVEHIRKHVPEVEHAEIRVDDATDQRALLALQGPAAPTILTALGADDAARNMAPFAVHETQIGGIACVLARTGYTGEDGYELSCAADQARTLWGALMQAGASKGLKPVGLGARDTLRLEAKLCLYGQDIDETTHPLEAGLGWVVKLDKSQFLGQSALRAIRQQGIQRKLVGFEMRGRGIARQGYPIVDGEGTEIGRVTSGAPGITIGKNVGLGYVPTALAGIGTSIGVLIRGKIIEAEIVRTPFYKRQDQQHR